MEELKFCVFLPLTLKIVICCHLLEALDPALLHTDHNVFGILLKNKKKTKKTMTIRVRLLMKSYRVEGQRKSENSNRIYGAITRCRGRSEKLFDVIFVSIPWNEKPKTVVTVVPVTTTRRCKSYGIFPVLAAFTIGRRERYNIIIRMYFHVSPLPSRRLIVKLTRPVTDPGVIRRKRLLPGNPGRIVRERETFVGFKCL